MKQTNGAVTLLLSAFKSIYRNAYVKGIASAVVLTAGLSAGAAQAAAVATWEEAAKVEAGLTAENALSISTTQDSVSGSVTIASGTSHKILADAETAGAATTVNVHASISSEDAPAILTVQKGATLTLEASGASNVGTIDVELDELTLANGSVLTVSRQGAASHVINLAADVMNIGTALTTGTTGDALNEIGKAGAVINLTDGGSITNTVTIGVKANTITVGAGAAFVQSGGTFNMQVADTGGDTSVKAGDQTLTVEEGGVFVVGGSTAATLGTNDTIDILGDDGLQAINGNTTGLTVGADNTLKLNLKALKSYTTASDFKKNIGDINFSTNTDAAGKLTLNGGTLVVKDETVSSYTDDFEGVLGSSALTTGTVQFNAVTFDKAADNSSTADVKAATLTLGTAGLADASFGVKSFTVTDTLNLIANADEDYRQVKDDLTLTAEGDGVINGNLEFNGSAKTFSVSGGDWVADGNLKFTEGTFKVTATDADDSASLTANGDFAVAAGKTFTVGGASNASGDSVLDLNGNVDLAGTSNLTAQAETDGTATIDLTDATLVNDTKDTGAAIKGTIKAEANGTVVITADKLEAAISNDAKNKGYVFNATGGTLKVTGDSLTLGATEVSGAAAGTSMVVIGANGTLDASDAVVTLDAGSGAAGTVTLDANSKVKAAGLNLAYTGADTKVTLEGGHYTVTGDVTGADGKTIKLGGTSASVLNLTAVDEATHTVTNNITLGNNSQLNVNDGNWTLADVDATNGKFKVSVTDLGGVVSVNNLKTGTAAEAVTVNGDDLTVRGTLTGTTTGAVKVTDGGSLTAAKLSIKTNTGVVDATDGSTVTVAAADVIKKNTAGTSYEVKTDTYVTGGIKTDGTSVVELNGLSAITGGDVTGAQAQAIKTAVLGASGTASGGIALGVGVSGLGTGTDVAYSGATADAVDAGMLEGIADALVDKRVTGVPGTGITRSAHFWGSAKLAENVTDLTIGANGTVSLVNAGTNNGMFVSNSKDELAGVKLTETSSTVLFEGNGKVGSITADGINEGKAIFQDGAIEVVGTLGDSSNALGTVEVQDNATVSSYGGNVQTLDLAGVLNVTEDADGTAGTGDLTVTGGTVYGLLNVAGKLSVGTSGLDVLEGGTVAADTLSLGGNTLFLDPAWEYSPSVGVFANVTTNATEINGTLSGRAIAGQNSMLYIGEEMGQAEARAYADANISETGVQAIAYLDKPITLGNTSALVVDGSATDKSVHSSTNGVNVSHGDLIITGNAFGAEGNDAAITLTDSTASNKVAAIGEDGRIVLKNVKAYQGADYTVISGANNAASITGFTAENTVFTNGLFDAEWDTTTTPGNAVLNVAYSEEKANATLAKTDSSIASMVKDFAKNSTADNAFDIGRDDGVGFVSRAVELGDAASVGKSLDSAAQFVTAGGVPQVSLMAQKAGVSAIETRMGFNGAVASAIGEVQGTNATVWVTPLYSSFESDSFDMGAQEGGVDADLFGVAVGSDFMVADALRLGVAFNVGSGDSDSEGDLASTSNDFEFLGANLYGGYEYGALAIMADLGYTMVSSDIDQSNAAGALSADIDSTVFSVGVQGKYVFDVSGFDIAPHLGVRYTRVDIEDYTVSGVLDGDSVDQSLVTFPVGVTFSKDIAAGDWDVKPVLDLSVIPAAGDTDVDVDSTFINMGDVSVNSEIVDSVSFGGKLGIEAEYGSFGLGLSYQYLGSSNVDSHNVMGNVRYSF